MARRVRAGDVQYTSDSHRRVPARGLRSAVADTLAQLRRRLKARTVDLDTVLTAVVDEAVRRLDADRATLYLLDRVRGELVSRVAQLPEIAEIRLKPGEGVAGWVAASGEVVSVPSDLHDPRFTDRVDARTGYVTQSLLAVPIRDLPDPNRTNRPTIGVLQVLNKAGGCGFDSDDQALLESLADGVAGLLAATSLGSQLTDEPNHPLSFGFNLIVGDSAPMRAVYELTTRAARTNATVLVRGESGTGKELIARAVHDNSDRRDGPLVVVDLAAMPSHLIESELFGHVRGAFTGAVRDNPGRVLQAHRGTLVLDEIGEVPLPLQAKLLRLIQARTFFPVGSDTSRTADVRFVCATHRDLEQMVRQGDFREDLYYRIRVVEIGVPPLRTRGHGDLDRLIDHFLYSFRRQHGRHGLQLTPEARARLHAHSWPGNVRELENRLESALILSPGSAIQIDDLRLSPIEARPARASSPLSFATELRSLRDVESDYVRWVVVQCDGNRSEAARRLGIGRNTLLRKLK